MTRKRPAATARPRQPSLQWRTAETGLLPHEIEADAVGVLVGLIEWAAREGLDVDALLRQARTTVVERAGDARR
jgi:hypothetical protein